MSRRTRTRLERGIFRDELGYAVICYVGDEQKEHRYPPDAAITFLRRERKEWQKTHEDEAAERARKTTPAPGTLRAVTPAYLETVPKTVGTKHRNETVDLRHWCSVFGDRAVDELTWQELSAQLTKWHDAGAAESTLNKRRQTLSNVFTFLNGPEGRNPLRAIKRLAEPEAEARGIALDIVRRILAEIPDRGRQEKKGDPPTVSKTRARIFLMATTGFPQAMIARLVPRDVNLKAGTVYLKPRRKGKGAAGRMRKLSPEAIAAFKLFIARDCFGPFSRRSLSKSFAAAVKKARRKWDEDQAGVRTPQPFPVPPGVRPYDLRHSFLSEAYVQTGDLAAVAELGCHSDLELTRRYTQAVVSTTSAAAIDAVSESQFLPGTLAPFLAPRKNVRKKG